MEETNIGDKYKRLCEMSLLFRREKLETATENNNLTKVALI